MARWPADIDEHLAKALWKTLKKRVKESTGVEIEAHADDIRHIKYTTFQFQVEIIDPWEHNRRVREYMREHGITDEDEDA